MALDDYYTTKRNFGHCRILWNIKNFSLVMCNPESVVTSEEFSITSMSVTRWHLGFSLKNDCNRLKLFLQRLQDDYEDSVQVSWRVTILDSKKEGTFIAEDQTVLSHYSILDVESEVPFNVVKVLNTGEPNELSIMIEIIVLLKVPMEIASPEAEPGVFNDLSFIYETGHHSNIAIKVNGTTLNLHKAMLFPRSRKLASLVGSTRKKMQLYYTDVIAIKKLFAYLYTANLKLIFDSPTISMNEYIRDLDIKELKNAYPQEKISMETVAHSNLFEFNWIIPELCNQKEMKESGIYEADQMHSCWQLRIYPDGLPEDSARRTKFIYIEALQLNRISNQDVYVDFKAIKKDGKVAAAKRKHGTVEKGSTLGERFMKLGSNAMTEALIGTGLHIKFLVCEATGQVASKITKTQEPLPFNLTNYDTYTISINYLGLLQTTHAYSDIILKVENREFRSHKFILAGRSSNFLSTLRNAWEENALLTLHNVNKYVFRVLLDFFYTDNITDNDVIMMMSVHDMAYKLNVSSLQKLCLAHIAVKIDAENVCDVLTFCHERSLPQLKTSALHIVFQVREVVVHSDGWNKMEAKYPQLARGILEFIRNNVNRLTDAVRDIIPEDPEIHMEEN